MTAVARSAPAQRAPRAQGPVELALIFAFGFVFATLFSWFIGFVIELVGIYTLWPEQAEGHSRALVVEDLGYIAATPRSLLIADTLAFSAGIVAAIEGQYERFGVLAWYRRAHGKAAPDAAPARVPNARMALVLAELSREASRWALISMYVAQDTLLRLAIAVFAAPAFVLACLLGAVDGLVRRDLRRWGGGRESSFVYHHAKRYTQWALTGGFTLYLAWPFGGFNPAYMVLVFTALVAATLSTAMASFKKYV